MNHQNDISSSSSPSPSYRKRKKTLKKKAEELSILCGVPVGLVCIEPDGKVETWPPDKDQIDRILQDYISKSNLNLASPSKKLDEKKKRVNYEAWDSRFDYLTEESLMEILKVLESKEKILEERLRILAVAEDFDDHYIYDITMSLNCLTCHDFERSDSWTEHGKGNLCGKLCCIKVERSWSGNLSLPRYEKINKASSMAISRRRKEDHSRLLAIGNFTQNVEPKLVRSSGMRRDWSFEDLRQQLR